LIPSLAAHSYFFLSILLLATLAFMSGCCYC